MCIDLDDSEAVFGYAADLMRALEAGIRSLWHDTIVGGDRGLSDRLVNLSKALRRARLVFEQEPVIGVHASSPTAHVQLADPGLDATRKRHRRPGPRVAPLRTVDPLEVLVTKGAEGVVVTAQGRITATSSPALALELATLLAEGVPVVLDLSRVTDLDADRVWVILEAVRLFEAHGNGFTLRGPNATVTAMLDAGQSAMARVSNGSPPARPHEVPPGVPLLMTGAG